MISKSYFLIFVSISAANCNTEYDFIQINMETKRDDKTDVQGDNFGNLTKHVSQHHRAIFEEYEGETATHIELTMTIKLSDIAALSDPKCRIKDPAVVEHKLNQLVCGGFNRLQIVADFDFTITKRQLENGERVLSSFALLEECPSLPESYRKKAIELKEKFFPIEIDPHVDKSEKIDAMVEWWRLSSDILKGFPLTQSEIESIAQRYKDATRDGAKDLFDKLYLDNVPILVFSAGLGDSVKAMLKYFNMLLPNVKVVSNFLKYKDGLLDGYDTANMIHVFNKNESALKDSKEFDFFHDRNNIIVMGDSLGDAGMGDGCVSGTEAHILKIGFLNEHVEANLPAYLDAFDIVLMDDQTMNVPRCIVDVIHQSQQ